MSAYATLSHKGIVASALSSHRVCCNPHHCNDSAWIASAPVICSEATTREPMAAWMGICGRPHAANQACSGAVQNL